MPDATPEGPEFEKCDAATLEAAAILEESARELTSGEDDEELDAEPAFQGDTFSS